MLNVEFQSLLELSDRSNAAASYRKQIKAIRKLIPKVTSRIELSWATIGVGTNNTEEDKQIIQPLDELVPSAALSYYSLCIRQILSWDPYRIGTESSHSDPVMRYSNPTPCP